MIFIKKNIEKYKNIYKNSIKTFILSKMKNNIFYSEKSIIISGSK